MTIVELKFDLCNAAKLGERVGWLQQSGSSN